MPRRVLSAFRSDSAGLVLVGVAYIGHGSTFIAGLPPSGWPAHMLETLATRPVWGLIWALVGIALLAIAWLRPQAPWGVSVAASMSTLWAVSWGMQSIIGQEARHAATAIGWALVTGLILWAFARGQAPEKPKGVTAGGNQ